MLRGTLRKGAFGQQCAFNGQLRQWRMLAIYSSVSPSLTSLPVVVSVLPAGQVYRFRSLSNVKSSRLKIPSSRTDLSIRNVWRNLLLVDDPVERRSRSVSAIGRQPLGLQSQPLLGPIDHRLGGVDLCLANGARGLYVDNHSELHIDEIVIGVGKKRRPAHRSRPLGGRIRRRDELGRNLARRTKGRVIKGCKIFLHRAACVFSGTLLAPFCSRNRTLLIGVRRDQAGIDSKPFAADEPCPDAGLHHIFEDTPENVTVTKPLIARA